MHEKQVVAKNPFFLFYYIYIIFHFFINLKKKVGFWPKHIFLTYLRQNLWPFFLKFLATKWVFGQKIDVFSIIITKLTKSSE